MYLALNVSDTLTTNWCRSFPHMFCDTLAVATQFIAYLSLTLSSCKTSCFTSSNSAVRHKSCLHLLKTGALHANWKEGEQKAPWYSMLIFLQMQFMFYFLCFVVHVFFMHVWPGKVLSFFSGRDWRVTH